MEFNLFEIEHLIDYYENEVARLQTRYDIIRLAPVEYDEDLKKMQLARIEDKKCKIIRRIKVLQTFEKEMD